MQHSQSEIHHNSPDNPNQNAIVFYNTDPNAIISYNIVPPNLNAIVSSNTPDLKFAMPRYYCDYCDTYLTHDSPSVRKQHNAGYKHKANVRTYYQQFEEQQTQSFIDQKIKEHLGQNQFQVGASFNQFLQAPRMPMFRPPMMPMGVPPFGIRPPVLPPPIGTPGYPQAPTTMGPPGAPPMNMPIPMPPAMNSAPNGVTPAPNAAPNTFTNPGMYQPSTSFAPASSSVPAPQSQETSAYSQTSENNH